MNNRSSFFVSLVSCLFGFLLTSHFHAQESQPLNGLFDFEDQQREYIYFAPTGLKENAPLLVVLHGFTSSAQKIMNYSRFNQLAKKHQFAVVYPQGSTDDNGNTFWNVGYDFHKNTNVNDIGFLISLVKTILLFSPFLFKWLTMRVVLMCRPWPSPFRILMIFRWLIWIFRNLPDGINNRVFHGKCRNYKLLICNYL